MENLSRIFGSPARLKTLRLFLLNQDRAFSVQETADRSKLTRESARYELAELTASGLLRKKGSKAKVLYQVNPRYEYLEAFDTFVRETANVRPKEMVKALKKAGTLQVVALSGHFMGLIEPQIDLLVVGDHISERVLAQVVKSLEAEHGREIRYASFATADFRYRREVYDRLLRDIFDYPHRLLIDRLGV